MMSDNLEENLRRALAELAASRSPEPDERLRSLSYRTSRRRMWPAIGAGGTALVGGIAAAAVLLLSSGASPAYAGWTAVPTTPSAATLAATTAACDAAWGGMAPSLSQLQPVLTDARGKYTAELYTSGGEVYECISDDAGHTIAGGDRQTLAAPAPAPDSLGPPSLYSQSAPGFPGSTDPNQQLPSHINHLINRLAQDPNLKGLPNTDAQRLAFLRQKMDSGHENNVYGRAGSDVSAVTLSFPDGSTVQATVENGWYFAWWPQWDEPTSMQITTSSGTNTAPISTSTATTTATQTP